ncbi:MAG: addiction module protein, partial [Vicinamibacterales bacterium]
TIYTFADDTLSFEAWPDTDGLVGNALFADTHAVVLDGPSGRLGVVSSRALPAAQQAREAGGIQLWHSPGDWPPRLSARALARATCQPSGKCKSSAMDSRRLLAEALQLSDEERAALAGELIQSLDHEVDPDAEAAWSAEIRARLEQVEAGTATTVSWPEARRRVHAATQRGSRSLSISSRP